MSRNNPAASISDLNTLDITIPLSAHDPSSGRTWVIAQPWEKLCDKYFTAGGFLSVEFDQYSARRSASDPGWRNRLEGADLMATGLMNSRMSSRDVDAILVNRERIEEALRAIPADLRLADTGVLAEPLYAHLRALFAAFRCPGVSVAKMMKTLCQKRPRLLPMLDSLVRKALYNSEDIGVDSDPDEFADGVVREVDLFRRVLLWGAGTPNANYPRLLELTDALAGRLADGGEVLPDLVTPVRILDDLVWFEWGGHEHYGWWENEQGRRIERSE
jgi:hypothetical protein